MSEADSGAEVALGFSAFGEEVGSEVALEFSAFGEEVGLDVSAFGAGTGVDTSGESGIDCSSRADSEEGFGVLKSSGLGFDASTAGKPTSSSG